MDSATLGALAKNLPAITLESTAVVVMDNKTAHLAGGHKAASAQQWPDDWIDALPEHFRNYRAVLWDIKGESMVVVPQGTFNETLPKITIRLNQKTKTGKAMSVVSLGSGQVTDLGNSKAYKLLLGKL